MNEFDFHLPLIWGILGVMVAVIALPFAGAISRYSRSGFFFLGAGLLALGSGIVLYLAGARNYSALHPFLVIGLGIGFVLGAIYGISRNRSASRSHP